MAIRFKFYIIGHILFDFCLLFAKSIWMIRNLYLKPNKTFCNVNAKNNEAIPWNYSHITV